METIAEQGEGQKSPQGRSRSLILIDIRPHSVAIRAKIQVSKTLLLQGQYTTTKVRAFVILSALGGAALTLLRYLPRLLP